MSRYIDADKIEFKPVEVFFEGKSYTSSEFFAHKKAIDEMPTADVEPVVRCAECKFFNREEATTEGRCRCDVNKLWQPIFFRPYKRFGDFCSYGAKMDGDLEKEQEQ